MSRLRSPMPQVRASMFFTRLFGLRWALAAALLVVAAPASAQIQTQTQPQSSPSDAKAPALTAPTTTGPVQLRQPGGLPVPAPAADAGANGNARPVEGMQRMPTIGEFEAYVNTLAAPAVIRRLGADLMTGPDGAPRDAVDYSPLVPPDYLVSPGDEIVLTLWGSVDAELRLVVDRTGRISIPRVGSIMVSGVRYGDLPDTIGQRVALVFKNFQISVSLGQLRGVRVYVTGFVERPGAYVVNALSSVSNVLVRAGGPSVSGSFRDIQLRRGRQLLERFDFYDLLIKGDRTHDRLVQADDVVHVGPVGREVAVLGSVNRPAIYELKPDETIAELVPMTGGFSAVADRTRFSLERVDEHATVRVTEVEMVNAATTGLRNGDVLRAFSAVSLATAVGRQNKRVRVEGEVAKPGVYVLPARSTIADALNAAGGMTEGAYVFGTDFSRESVRIVQQQNYERALRDLETEFERSTSTQRVTSGEEATALAARSAATARLIARLRGTKPTGRVVLQLQPDSRELPDLLLEDGDRLYLPPVPTSVGVFGSVFNAGNYLRVPDRNLDDYLRQAGGPTRGADKDSTFVIRANGTVISALQSKTWFGSSNSGIGQLPALPGDTVFVPEEIDKTTFVQYAKDWTQILYQFALGVAAFVTLTN